MPKASAGAELTTRPTAKKQLRWGMSNMPTSKSGGFLPPRAVLTLVSDPFGVALSTAEPKHGRSAPGHTGRGVFRDDRHQVHHRRLDDAKAGEEGEIPEDDFLQAVGRQAIVPPDC